MKTIDYKLPGGDLASRRLAIPERHKIEAFLVDGKRVRIDLAGVESVSESYSDEVFGILVVKLGVKTILTNVKFENATPSILKSIAKVIQRRSHEIAKKEVNPIERVPRSNSSWVTC